MYISKILKEMGIPHICKNEQRVSSLGLVEYNDGNNLKKMWIEDIKSLKEKVSLITNYKLGGVASWEKGMETDEVWELFKEALK